MTVLQQYDQPEYSWITRIARGIGIDVLVSGAIRRCAVDRGEHVIWLPMGLSLTNYHWAVARASMHHEFPGCCPEFLPRDPSTDQQVTRGAQIIPFPGR